MAFTITPARAWSRECVELILRHHLDVPADRFFKMDLEEFNKRQREAGHTGGVSWDPWTLLLVSKTWRDVGEQLLYHTVVVRSLAQAYTLMDTFRGNPRLAGFVRRLRFEGAYGVASTQIIHFTAPTVTDVWLNISDATTDPALVQPYRVALAWMNPRRCALYYPLFPITPSDSDPRMWSSVARWTNLRHLSLPSASYYMSGIVQAMKTSNIRFLETFELTEVCGKTPQIAFPLHALKAIATNNSGLRKIIFRDGADSDLLQYFRESFPGLELADRSTSKISQFPRSFPVEILDIIIGHALADSKPISSLHAMKPRAWYDRATALNFLVVCGAFKELTLTRLCRWPCISDSRKLVQFTNLIRTRDDLIQRVVGVTLTFGTSAAIHHHHEIYYGTPSKSTDLADMFALNFFLATMPNLRSITFSSSRVEYGPFPLSSSLLSVMGTLAHLEELSGASIGWSSDSSSVSPATLASFTSLQRLLQAKWVVPIGALDDAVSNWAPVFSSLQELDIRQIVGSPLVMWPILQAIDLPELRRFGFPTIKLPEARGFFAKHGKKLERLATMLYNNMEDSDTSLTELCPNLTEIELWAAPGGKISHDSVETVVVSIPDALDFLSWMQDLASDDPQVFPSVRKVQNMKLDNWDARRWQLVSSGLLSDRNIVVVDRSGCAWRPRLARLELLDDEPKHHPVRFPPDFDYDGEEDYFGEDHYSDGYESEF